MLRALEFWHFFKALIFPVQVNIKFASTTWFADNEFKQRWWKYLKNYFTVLWYFDVICLTTSFLISCINYLTFTFSMKAFLKKLDIHVFLVKHNSLLKNAKGNSFTAFSKHADWWQWNRESYLENSPYKLSKIRSSL